MIVFKKAIIGIVLLALLLFPTTLFKYVGEGRELPEFRAKRIWKYHGQGITIATDGLSFVNLGGTECKLRKGLNIRGWKK